MGVSTPCIRISDRGETLLVGLFEETRPVPDRPIQEACKDKIEGRGKVPVILNIINKEFTVRRDEGGLDGTEISAGDLCGVSVFIPVNPGPNDGQNQVWTDAYP